MNVVLDTNVVVSAMFWPGESRDCVVAWARRRFHLAVTVAILQEYDEVARRMHTAYPDVDPGPWVRWIERKAQIYEPAPLGKQRSRDPDDDLFLSCALASGAKVVVSKDRDLLALEKPFGVEILTPRLFLSRLERLP
ncbi:MAG: putative toxin-antitoxin system toxin component, PIN family [Verrucomicrobia bacterium]|nr:putative toxin-antitoxin system toxin component, PIN family [Verrucomicrobiota bacterium]